MHSVNSQVFRGFFQGRYIFDTVTGFLRYATPGAPGSGFGPDDNASHLLLYLQGAGPSGPATDAAGASNIKNEDYALFAQDKWQVRPNFTLSYRLALGSANLPRSGGSTVPDCLWDFSE